MEKIPPFQPGNKVVSISDLDTRIGGGLSADSNHVYVVEDIWWCCEGTGFRVSLCSWPCPASGKYVCAVCHSIKGGDGWSASSFRKVDDISNHTVESLLEELTPAIEEPILT
jgi:hypothetical protein